MDELIQEWMCEDKYLVKLTKRQRSIASKKLRYKLAPYVKDVKDVKAIEKKYTPKFTKRQRSIASKKLSNKLLHCEELDEEIQPDPPKSTPEAEPEAKPEAKPKVDPEDTKVKTDVKSEVKETIKRKVDLIHEWINEDQLLTKYTKRQKVILCKNLIQKLDTHQDRELERVLEESTVATQELESKLARYRKAYHSLLRTTYSTRSADRFCKMIWVIWLTLMIRSIVNTLIASIPPGWCSATALHQTEPYKTLGLP
jgi:hypothetical protein